MLLLSALTNTLLLLHSKTSRLQPPSPVKDHSNTLCASQQLAAVHTRFWARGRRGQQHRKAPSTRHQSPSEALPPRNRLHPCCSSTNNQVNQSNQCTGQRRNSDTSCTQAQLGATRTSNRHVGGPKARQSRGFQISIEPPAKTSTRCECHCATMLKQHQRSPQHHTGRKLHRTHNHRKSQRLPNTACTQHSHSSGAMRTFQHRLLQAKAAQTSEGRSFTPGY